MRALPSQSEVEVLEPLADAIGRHVWQGLAMFADDTPVTMLSPGAGGRSEDDRLASDRAHRRDHHARTEAAQARGRE